MRKLVWILVLALVASAQAYPKIVNKASLVGWWTMDAVSGSTVEDSSGSGATGTAAGGGTQVAGKFGNGWSFDGVDDRISCTHKSSQLLSAGGTIAAWIKPDQTAVAARIVHKGSGFGSSGYSFFLLGDQLGAETATGGAILASSGSVKYSTWSHVLVTFSGTNTVTLYSNGVRLTSGSSGLFSGITSTQPLEIGRRTDAADRQFKGTIDDVRIYNRVLTLSEIRQQYLSGRSGYGY